MKIVIDIPDEDYEYIKLLHEGLTDYQTTLNLYRAVKNGKPLPNITDEQMNSIWLMVGKNTFMCPVCKAQITGDENIKYQRYCYWCGTKMTQDEESENDNK